MAASLAPPQAPMSRNAIVNEPIPPSAAAISPPSDSPVDSPRHHEEVMTRLSAKGAFEGKDVNHLTPQQESELVDRIAEAFITCAICSEIFYLPLTIQPCLHTFCGRCLRNWFKGQAVRGQPRSCPSCRESIAGVKTDRLLVRLLEGWLKVHPDRNPESDMTEAEKRESSWALSPGGDANSPSVRVVPANTAAVPMLSVPNVEKRAAREPKWETGLMYPEIYGPRKGMTRSRSAQPPVSRTTGAHVGASQPAER